jgi:ABC-type molybdate transport system permease subunit
MRTKLLPAIPAVISLMCGCTHTFMGTVFVLSFKDIILYILIAFILAILISLKSSGSKRKAFWICFILSLVLTPLAGFIYLLILFTRNQEESD